jgi:hypothetical protein
MSNREDSSEERGRRGEGRKEGEGRENRED